jgi:capsular exopolysaccharide synthesis family protein
MKECDFKVVSNKKKDILFKLLTNEKSNSQALEAYKLLLANINVASYDNKLNQILITSTNRHEGKTSVTVNLSVVIANSGKKVLVIDADLRNPSIHNYFKIKKEPGLTNLMAKNKVVIEHIQKTDIQGVSVLASGAMTSNSTELFGTDRLKSILGALSCKYDVILIDSPPVDKTTDSVFIATICHGVIFVCEPNKTKIDDAKESIEKLRMVGSNILGVVLNKYGNHKK